MSDTAGMNVRPLISDVTCDICGRRIHHYYELLDIKGWCYGLCRECFFGHWPR